MTIVNMVVDHNCSDRSQIIPSVYIDSLGSTLGSCEMEKKFARLLASIVQVTLVKMTTANQATATCRSRVEDADALLLEFGIEVKVKS